jgi:hypothetical protein
LEEEDAVIKEIKEEKKNKKKERKPKKCSMNSKCKTKLNPSGCANSKQ